MIHIGCCGFPVKRSVYYQTFTVVEIQQTFYQLPLIHTGKRWKEEAPLSFEFTMKAWQLITHEPSSPTYRRLRMAIPEKKKKAYGFFRATEEVAEAWLRTVEFAKALGVKKIVFQSPASFHPSDDHIQNLKQFFKRMTPHPFTLIWEPRGKWEGREVKRVCAELDLIPCLDPFEETSIQGDLLYTRLHGREGYRYTYPEIEMKQLIRIGKSYSQAYFMFNNMSMYEDAQQFRKLSE
jgi:uncharacterized protein YecE (DUF72 family)